jgi:hypothetical protein
VTKRVVKGALIGTDVGAVAGAIYGVYTSK